MPRGSKTHTTLVGAVGGIYSILGAGKDVLHTRLSSNAGHSGGRVGSRGDGGSDGRLGSGAGCGGHIGIGSATGDNKAIEAARIASTSPLLETSIEGASDIIINISGDITLLDANEAATYIQDLAGEDTNIIFGSKYDDSKETKVKFLRRVGK